MAHRFTIGVEEEFQIIDPATCELRSHVMQLLSAASPDRFVNTAPGVPTAAVTAVEVVGGMEVQRHGDQDAGSEAFEVGGRPKGGGAKGV